MLNNANVEKNPSAISRISFPLFVAFSGQLTRHMLVDQKGFTGVFDFRDGAFEVEGFGEDDLEDLCSRVSLGILGLQGKFYTFCTLILWLVLLKIKLARIALAKRRA